jgi:2-polyprenyl-6-methoxyphenol hydroxylase-like FAD-dependent oxidoreductase
MNLPRSAAVVVAGGGPAGLAAAIELGTRGIEVLVLEPRTEVSFDRPRAKTTSARTMEHLRRWGLADRVRQVAPLPVAWSQEAAFVTSLLGEEVTRFTDCFGLSPGRPDSGAESGQQIPQPLLESVLRDAVEQTAPACLATGWSLAGLRESPDGVVVDARHLDGTPRQVRAQYVLGCDGSRSQTRDAIGERYTGSTDARTNFNLVFKAPGLGERMRLRPAIHYWVLDAEVPGLVGPLDLHGTWWGMVMGVDAETGERDSHRLLRHLIGPGAEDIDLDVVATDPWTARMLIARSYGGGRVYLVGDAVHLNPPFGGHGFNTAIGDAINIGWKLAAVLQGWAGPEILHSYEAERRPVAQQTIDEATTNMRTLSKDLAHPALAAIGPAGEAARRAAAREIQATKDSEFHSLGLVLGYRYDASPIVPGDAMPAPAFDPRRYVPSTRPGGRLPHAWLPDGRSLYDLLSKDMTLLLLDRRADPASFVAEARKSGVPLGVVDVSAVPLPGRDGAAMLLIRPDQHIAWRGLDPVVSPEDAAATLRYTLARQAQTRRHRASHKP